MKYTKNQFLDFGFDLFSFEFRYFDLIETQFLTIQIGEDVNSITSVFFQTCRPVEKIYTAWCVSSQTGSIHQQRNVDDKSKKINIPNSKVFQTSFHGQPDG